jgi:quercetin dioxygenase-like cupin family protein
MFRIPTQLFFAFVGMTAVAPPFVARADDVPDALSVEWQGQKPCEKFFEDAQIRISRCSFPPGAMHVCHSHPSYVYYVLSGGKVLVQDASGTRDAEVRTGTFVESPPVSWHEIINVGDTNQEYLIIEKKYQMGLAANKTECPIRTR